jgi:hypothetical protein
MYLIHCFHNRKTYESVKYVTIIKINYLIGKLFAKFLNTFIIIFINNIKYKYELQRIYNFEFNSIIYV